MITVEILGATTSSYSTFKLYEDFLKRKSTGMPALWNPVHELSAAPKPAGQGLDYSKWDNLDDSD